MHHLLKNYQHIAYFNFEDPRIINFDIHDFSKLDEIIPSKVEAYFFDENKIPQIHHEKSTFIFFQDKWFYVDGKFY